MKTIKFSHIERRLNSNGQQYTFTLVGRDHKVIGQVISYRDYFSNQGFVILDKD